MKRFFALAALVLGLAACQTEPEGLDVNAGGAVDTTITVSLPETTRANSALGAFDNVDLGTEDDTKTIRYILKIYQKVGDEYKASTDRQVEYSDEKSVVFPVRLVPNRDYRFVVWADYVESKNDTDFHYNTHNDGELANITLNDTWFAMDETRDAFTGYFDTADGDKRYSAGLPINIILKRPFAKLRVITTDMKELGYLGINPTHATVEYTVDHYNAFNAFAGQVIKDSKNRDIKHENFEIKTYGDNVDKKSMVLFTDYFFAENGDAVSFVLDVYEDEQMQHLIKSNNFSTDIAVNRNYLTTIQGNILTEGNNITVEVEDAFENAGSSNPNYEYATISSEAELLAAIDNGGKYIVISDIDVTGLVASTQAATRTTGTTTTINLNGYTITLKTNLTIPEGKTVIINNDPVDNAGNELGKVVNEGGQIINNGTLNIEGGEFGENTIENNGKVNVNGDDVDDNAIVNKDNAVVGSFIYNIDQLRAAVENAVAGTANEFTFAANIEGEVTISQEENVNITINGAGFEFDGTFTIDGNNRSDGEESVTFYNIKFNAENATGSMNFIYAPFSIGNRENLYAHNIIVDGCTFTGGETVVGVRAEQTYGVTIKNSTFTGMHSIGQIKSANKFTHLMNVEAECLGGVNFNNQAANVVLDGCRITATDADGYCVRTDHTAGSSLTIKNSTLTGYCPIVLRSCSDQAYIKLENNTLVKGGLYDINVKSGVMPQNEGIEDYIVYPREVYVADGFYQTSAGYTIKNAAENSTITLADNVNGAISIEKVKNITIEGNENTNVRFVTTADSKLENVTIKSVNFVYDGSNVNFGIVINAEAKIENLVVEGCSFVGTGAKAGRGIYGQNSAATITLKNCSFKDLGYPVYTMAPGGYASLVVEGCTFEGIKSWAIMPQYNDYAGDLTVTGNQFINCVGGLVKAGKFTAGHTFTFTNNVVTNSAEHPAKNWFTIDTTAAAKVVENNTKDGQAWTPAEAEGLN